MVKEENVYVLRTYMCLNSNYVLVSKMIVYLLLPSDSAPPTKRVYGFFHQQKGLCNAFHCYVFLNLE